MGFLKRAKRRICFLLLDYLNIKEAAQDWSARYQQRAPLSLDAPSTERHTGALEERDLEAALKAHEEAQRAKRAPTTQGTALNVDLDTLDRPGALAQWYYHSRVIDTMEFPAISKWGNEKPRTQR